MGLPDGWNDYDRIGKQVNGTRFVAFKVPLREATNKGSQVPEDQQLYPKLLVNLIPNLGLVIDLTNTKKYYHPDEFEKLGVAYQKIQVEGHVVPKNLYSKIFRETVNAFLEENADNDKLIGVHCTHGLNRSGFIICRYMIEELKIPPLEAIAAFEAARGHKMERENYIEKLKNLSVNDNNDTGDVLSKIPKKEKLPSLAIDTDVDKGTQTIRGYWIDEQQLPAHHRSFGPRALDTSDHAIKQVSLMGCVDIRRRDLIPDGRGGYFVHITSKEIERIPRRSDSQQQQYQRQPQRYENNYRHPSAMTGNARSNRPNIMPRSKQHQPNRPYHVGNSNRYAEQHSRSMPQQSLPMQMPPYNHQMPIGGNNMAEELLRMQQMQAPPQHQQNWRSNNFLQY